MSKNITIMRLNFLRFYSPLCMQGDGYCDDVNNHKDCDYDGGDCCGENVKKSYCNICECLDPYYKCEFPQNQGDGFCDDGNNKYDCLWDGGDCCGDNVKKEYCKICECKTCEFSQFWKDGFCDDGNNNMGCQFDGGDCCGPNVNTNYCKICECLQKEPRVSDNYTVYNIVLHKTRAALTVPNIPAKAQQCPRPPWVFTGLVTALSFFFIPKNIV